MKKYLCLFLLVYGSQLFCASDSEKEERNSEEMRLLIPSDKAIRSLAEFFQQNGVVSDGAKAPYYRCAIFEVIDQTEDAGIWMSDIPVRFRGPSGDFIAALNLLMRSNSSFRGALTSKKGYRSLLRDVAVGRDIPGCTVYAGPMFFEKGVISVGDAPLTLDEFNEHIVGTIQCEDRLYGGLKIVALVIVCAGLAAIIYACDYLAKQYMKYEK